MTWRLMAACDFHGFLLRCFVTRMHTISNQVPECWLNLLHPQECSELQNEYFQRRLSI